MNIEEFVSDSLVQLVNGDDIANFPPKFQPLLKELAVSPPAVREMWHYALVLMMIDAEKARVVASRQQADELLLVVRTNAGDEFSVVRPALSEGSERMLLEEIREIVQDAE